MTVAAIEYVADLQRELRATRLDLMYVEADLRDARLARQRAEERIADLETDLFRSEELRGAVVSLSVQSTVLSAKVTEESLKRLEIWEPIVEAACDLFTSKVSRSEGLERVYKATALEIERREKTS